MRTVCLTTSDIVLEGEVIDIISGICLRICRIAGLCLGTHFDNGAEILPHIGILVKLLGTVWHIERGIAQRRCREYVVAHVYLGRISYIYAELAYCIVAVESIVGNTVNATAYGYGFQFSTALESPCRYYLELVRQGYATN